MPPVERLMSFRDSALFVLGLEGEDSGAEFRYFKTIEDLGLLDRRRIRLVPCPTSSDDHASSPRSVLQRVRSFVSEHRLKAFDRVWLIIDIDMWTESELREVVDAARLDGYGVAVSNSCFEVWLLFHQASFSPEALVSQSKPKRSASAKSAWGGDRVAITAETVRRACDEARRRADTDGTKVPWPSCPGSWMFRLFDEFVQRNLLRAEYRPIFQAPAVEV